MNQFIKLFIRNIRNNPKLFLINVTSFSIGIVTVLFITLFVVKEFRADRFHPKHKDIYRVLASVWDSPQRSASTEFPLGGLFKDNHPEIEDFSRYRELTRYQVTVDNKEFTDQKISWVDASFFNMFNFKLKLGNVNSLFDHPNTIIIDQKTAKLYFNTIDVIGKTISAIYPGEEERKNYTIVGVLDRYPEESTLQPKLITDNKSLAVKFNNDYSSSVTQLYLYVPNCPSPRDLAQALSITYRKKRNSFYGRNDPINKDLYTLQPLTDLYLHSTDVTDGLPKGDYLLVWVLTGIGVILLVVTFMNYLILTLGASLKNQKQNQIRTILGSGTSWLKMKYASESVFYSLITFVAALFLFPFVHRIISSFTEIRYGIFSISEPKIVVLFLLALILIGASIGYLQYNLLFHPKYKNTQLAGFKTRKPFFNYLIQFQLLIFIVIISSTILINRQMQFIQNQDKGYDLKNTIPITINDELNMELFMKECRKYSFIRHTSVGHNMFCNTPLNEITIEKSNEIVKSQYIWGDNNYIDTYNIKLLYGENIEGDKLPPVTQWWKYPKSYDVMDILVNEEFVRKARLENPIGTIVTIDNNGIGKGQICGVIADVKNSTFYHAVTPMVIGFGISYMPSIIVSVQEGHLEEFKTMINKFFIKIGKEDHIGYQTWNFDYEVWYHKEQVLIRLLSVLSFVLLVILLLGIYGTSMFISENKTKEIGIRKVNGAKISEILAILNKDFIKWVAIAFIIATPIAYYAMTKWLENFAYKTTLSWWIFALAGLLALGIALLTVSWQSWRAATRNPVESLRYE